MSVWIPPPQPDHTPLHIVSLGSSFAAGPGISPIADKGAGPGGRSSKNYAHLLAQKLNARLTDLSVSGAKLEEMVDEGGYGPHFGRWFPPQAAEVPEDADVVMILGGGNDIGYIQGMISDDLAATMLGKLASRVVGRGFAVPYRASKEEVAKRVVAVVDMVRERAPKVKILLIEYFTLLGTDVKCGRDVNLSEAQIEKHKGVALELREAYRLAAEARPDVEVVPIAEFSIGNGLGSKKPWVEGFSAGVVLRGKTPLHPNAEGMRNVADMLCEKIQSLGIDTLSNRPDSGTG